MILHLPIIFDINGTSGPPQGIKVMTSYRFSKWRPLSRKSTSGFGFTDSTRLGISKFICIPYQISICGWDITTSGFWIRTSAILDLYFQFRLWPIQRHRQSACHFASACQISSKSVNARSKELWRHIDFSSFYRAALYATRSFLWQTCLSVRLSVRLSAKRVHCDKRTKVPPTLLYHVKGRSIYFFGHKEWLVEDAFFYLKYFESNWPTQLQKRGKNDDFQSIFAGSGSTLRPSEKKVQLWLIWTQ